MECSPESNLKGGVCMVYEVSGWDFQPSEERLAAIEAAKRRDEEFEERKEVAVSELMAKYGLVQEGSRSVLRSFYRKEHVDRPEGFVWVTENPDPDDHHQPLVLSLMYFERLGEVEKHCPFSQVGYGVPYWISNPFMRDGRMEVTVHTECGALSGDTWWVRVLV